MGDPNNNPWYPLPPIIQLKDESEEQRKSRRALEESYREVFDSELREIRKEIADGIAEDVRALERLTKSDKRPFKAAERVRQNRCSAAVLKSLLVSCHT